jgi:Ca2+-binding RTX toxin-like protein
MRIIEDCNGRRIMLRGAAAAVVVLLGIMLLAVAAADGAIQGQGHAHAAPYTISGEESCLALPAKVKWDPDLNRCALRGPMAILAGDVLTVGQGVTFSVDPRAKITNSGTIANSANATLLVAGKITNSQGATLVNSGSTAVSGIFSNAGAIVNSADATLKNIGRITNSGTIANSAGAQLYNLGRITNNAIINNQGQVENRGTLIVSEEAMLSSLAGATVKNSGRVMAYCGAQVAGAIMFRQATDKCDDPPAASMGAWSPFSPVDTDGEVDTVFTFKASASDDIKLAKVEWDFDGDGEVDHVKQLFGKSATAVATHSYGAQGVYHPQVRAVDSAGARSAWDRYSAAGLEAAEAKNTAPMAANATMTAEQDSFLELTLEAVDAEGDELTFSISAPPAHGMLLGDAPELSYIPDEGYAGPDSFTFTASDGKKKSLPATVSITVGGNTKIEAKQETQAQPSQRPEAPPAEPPNSTPVANGQSVSTMEEAPASVRLTATDGDGDWLEYRVVSEPAHGMLSGTAPDLTYIPDAEFYGHDSFAFMASDSFGGASTATIYVTVGAVNDMPVAYDDDASTAHGASVSIDVLANDEDVEAEFLSIASVTAPQNGSAAPSNGLVTYSPNPGFSGTDYFTYTISDGEGGAATATVRVAVAAAAPAPASLPEPVPVPPQPLPEEQQQYCGRPASSFARVFEGTEGSDELTGSKEDDLIIGKAGNDVLRGKAGNDCIVGGAGDDRIYGDKGLDVIEGGEGSDSMWGGAEDDRMWGGAGSDKVVGDGGADMLWGDGGEDRMWGGPDNDILNAGAGDDKLVGDGGSDVLNGEAGDDRIYDDLGDDTIDGGEGSDKCWDIIGSNQVLACEARS